MLPLQAYTKEEILSMEVLMLTVLEFAINCPTVAHFFERLLEHDYCAHVLVWASKRACVCACARVRVSVRVGVLCAHAVHMQAQ